MNGTNRIALGAGLAFAFAMGCSSSDTGGAGGVAGTGAVAGAGGAAGTGGGAAGTGGGAAGTGGGAAGTGGGAAGTGGGAGASGTGGAAGSGSFWPAAYNASCAPSGGAHRPGEDCLGCHKAGGVVSGMPFALGGTVYSTATTGKANVEVGVKGSSTTLVVCSNAQGNFWFAGTPVQPIDWSSAEVRLRDGDDAAHELKMPTSPSGGGCNGAGCHAAGSFSALMAP
jgi:hypothetical protein